MLLTFSLDPHQNLAMISWVSSFCDGGIEKWLVLRGIEMWWKLIHCPKRKRDLRKLNFSIIPIKCLGLTGDIFVQQQIFYGAINQDGLYDVHISAKVGFHPIGNHGSHCFEHSKLGSDNIHLKYSRLNMNIKNYPIGYWRHGLFVYSLPPI